jgi:hypothetical protein
MEEVLRHTIKVGILGATNILLMPAASGFVAL